MTLEFINPRSIPSRTRRKSSGPKEILPEVEEEWEITPRGEDLLGEEGTPPGTIAILRRIKKTGTAIRPGDPPYVYHQVEGLKRGKYIQEDNISKRKANA